MKLLADENVDVGIVHWLRELKHDVLWAAESLAGQPDPIVLHQALIEQRVLVTNDLGFGEMVFRQRLLPAGVLMIRFRVTTTQQRLETFRCLWPRVEAELVGNYTVLRDRKIRRRRLPP